MGSYIIQKMNDDRVEPRSRSFEDSRKKGISAKQKTRRYRDKQWINPHIDPHSSAFGLEWSDYVHNFLRAYDYLIKDPSNKNRKAFLMKYIAFGNEHSLSELMQWHDQRDRPQVFINWEQVLLHMKNTANDANPINVEATKHMIGWLLAEGQTGDIFPTLQPYTTQIGERLLHDKKRGGRRRTQRRRRRKKKTKKSSKH